MNDGKHGESIQLWWSPGRGNESLINWYRERRFRLEDRRTNDDSEKGVTGGASIANNIVI